MAGETSAAGAVSETGAGVAASGACWAYDVVAARRQAKEEQRSKFRLRGIVPIIAKNRVEGLKIV